MASTITLYLLWLRYDPPGSWSELKAEHIQDAVDRIQQGRDDDEALLRAFDEGTPQTRTDALVKAHQDQRWLIAWYRLSRRPHDFDPDDPLARGDERSEAGTPRAMDGLSDDLRACGLGDDDVLFAQIQARHDERPWSVVAAGFQGTEGRAISGVNYIDSDGLEQKLPYTVGHWRHLDRSGAQLDLLAIEHPYMAGLLNFAFDREEPARVGDTACLEGVLSRLPLETLLSADETLVMTALFRLRDLEEPKRQPRHHLPRSESKLWCHLKLDRPIRWTVSHEVLDEFDGLRACSSAEHDETELEFVAFGDAVESVSTDPPMPCIGASVPERVAGLQPVQDRFTGMEVAIPDGPHRVNCRFLIPLAAPPAGSP